MGRPTIKDEVLGRLKWNSEQEWYEGGLLVPPKSRVDLFVKCDTDNSNACVAYARKVAATINAHSPYFSERAAKDLLQAYNENWNSGNPIDTNTFALQLSLRAILVSPDGAQLYYNDGDLFLGHDVLVTLTRELKYSEAAVSG